MDTAKKVELLQKQKHKYYGNKSKSVDSCIDTFKKKIKECPYYICCVCNRMLYKKSVLQLTSNRYPSQHLFNVKISFDGKIYVCNTCHSKAIQGKVPCQATLKNLYFDDVPTKLESLKKLEQIIIARQIVFEKILVNCDQTCNIFPDRSGIILLKLKRKIQFRGHDYFEAVRPEFIMTALNWLKANKILCKDIQIDCTNISTELTSIMNDEVVDHTNSSPINSSQNSLEKNTFKKYRR